jgi:hypothetical protein
VEKNNYYIHGLLLDIEIETYKSNLQKEKESVYTIKQKILEIFEKLIIMDFIKRKYWKWRKQNFIENSI